MSLIGFDNGTFCRVEEITYSVNDLAISRGIGAFEYLRTYQKIPFHLEDHIDRLISSCKQLQLPLNMNKKTLMTFIQQVIEYNFSLDDMGLKILVTPIMEQDLFTFHKVRVVIIPSVIPLPPGRSLILGTTTHLRTFAEAKSTNYLAAIVAKRTKPHVDDIIFINGKNELLECSRSNLVVVENGMLYTAKEGVLQGITLSIIKDLAQDYLFIEKAFPLEKLWHAQEAFITSTNYEILPVSEIDNVPLPNSYGPITKDLQQKMKQYIAKQTDVARQIQV